MYMPTPEQFQKGIIKLEQFLKYYKENDENDKRYTLFLSSGVVLEFSFKKENLIDLLGVKMNNLKHFGLVTTVDPLEQLEEMIANKDIIYQTMLQNEKSYSLFFYGNFSTQVYSLFDVLQFTLNQIGFVSSYESSKSRRPIPMNNFINYFITFTIGENLVFLGLKKIERGSYIPILISCKDDEYKKQNMLESILCNQRMMNVSGIKYSSGESCDLSMEDNYRKTEGLLDLARKYKAELCVTKDYFHAVRVVSQLSATIHSYEHFCTALTQALQEGTEIDPSVLALSRETTFIKPLLDAYNQHIGQKEADKTKKIEIRKG